jgi:hypothetical protein
MQSTYLVVRTNWMGSRYSVRDGGGKEIYTIRGTSRRFKFFPPGSETPRFEARPVSLFTFEIAFVDSAVDYTFGYMKPLKSSSISSMVLLNVARAEVGLFQNEFTDEAVDKAVEPLDEKRMGSWAALKLAYKKLSDLARMSELVVDGKPVVRFEKSRDRKSVAVTVLRQSLRDIDERHVLILALRCFTTNKDGS